MTHFNYLETQPDWNYPIKVGTWCWVIKTPDYAGKVCQVVEPLAKRRTMNQGEVECYIVRMANGGHHAALERNLVPFSDPTTASQKARIA